MLGPANSVVDKILLEGYARLVSAAPAMTAFTEACKAYDTVADLAERDEIVAITLGRSAEDWTSESARSAFYARAPMGYRNRARRAEKERKSYFQFSPPYAQFVRETYPRFLSQYSEIEWLFSASETLWNASVFALRSVILDFDRSFPGIQRLLLRERPSQPVILRLLRYDPGDHIESFPHRDKSAFTIHLHSDDEAGAQFVLASPRKLITSISDMHGIARETDSPTANDAIVFPGLFLAGMGYEEIQATPHAARGISELRLRHASVAFWLIPNMITDHLITTMPTRDAA